VKLSSFVKTYIFSLLAKPIFFWLNFSNSWQNLYFLLANSWQNLYFFLEFFFLAKPIFFIGKFFFSSQSLYFFLTKLFSLGKIYNSFWLNFFVLAKLISFIGFCSLLGKPISILG